MRPEGIPYRRRMASFCASVECPPPPPPKNATIEPVWHPPPKKIELRFQIQGFGIRWGDFFSAKQGVRPAKLTALAKVLE